MFRLVVIIFFFLAFVSCRPRYQPEPLFESNNDFENYAGWSDSSSNAYTLHYGEGHSGNYCIKVSKQHPFSAFFKLTFNQIPDERPTRLLISVFYKVNSKAISKTAMVCHIQDAAKKTLHWIEFPLVNESQETGKWMLFKKEVDITWVAEPKNTMAVLFWNHDTEEEVLIDDISLKYY